jgi:NAD(P)-dependent dehydrogenase (short-subunit alcohol dehydrogenase family)
MPERHLVIFGASRGLGAAFNLGLPEPGDTAWLVSRGRPDVDRADGARRAWVRADLASAEAPGLVGAALAGERVDALIYNAGIWEADAFEPGYDFASVSPDETARILAVNLTAAIHCVQALLPNLRRSPHGKIILVGSTSGLENSRAPEVAYGASKFGLRGAAHALRQHLRPDRIGVTVLNPGTIASVEAPYELGREAVLAAHGTRLIPMHDLVALVKCVLSLSAATCVKEIDVPAMDDLEA